VSGSGPDRSVTSPEEAKLPRMATYIFGLLRRAPNRPEISEAQAELIQEGHLAHIRHMREQGNLIVAGPFMDDGDLRGILIFRDRTIEEVLELSRADPALQARRLILELHELYAPAGLDVPRDGASSG